eukprot:Pompholyxophrys_punicea_v1_NODE_253_length_2527_cov_28.889608.p1 type:complete len:237 gc:universal NODE_253_length_2527_cov_28.889608:1735-2445(+)
MTPPDFQKLYTDIEIFNVDITYFYLEKPLHIGLQKLTYCNYKARNLLKFAAVTTTDGSIVLMSEPKPGSWSDQEVWLSSGFTDIFERRAAKTSATKIHICVDKGMGLYFKSPKIIVREPTRVIAGTKFSKETCEANYETAQLRISVEQAFGRLKQFRLLSGTIDNNMIDNFDHWVLVGGYFNNHFRKGFRNVSPRVISAEEYQTMPAYELRVQMNAQQVNEENSEQSGSEDEICYE